MPKRILLCALLLAFGPARGQQPPLPTVQLGAGLYLIRAEVADRDETRAVGLMNRRSLAPNGGMLFLFEAPGLHCMWMRNTLIPLSVAFVDEAGTIVNIADMQPLSEESHCAARPARYALEMAQGWFAQRGLGAGLRLRGLRPAQAR